MIYRPFATYSTDFTNEITKITYEVALCWEESDPEFVSLFVSRNARLYGSTICGCSTSQDASLICFALNSLIKDGTLKIRQETAHNSVTTFSRTLEVKES